MIKFTRSAQVNTTISELILTCIIRCYKMTINCHFRNIQCSGPNKNLSDMWGFVYYKSL